jgi:hypothetical protein
MTYSGKHAVVALPALQLFRRHRLGFASDGDIREPEGADKDFGLPFTRLVFLKHPLSVLSRPQPSSDITRQSTAVIYDDTRDELPSALRKNTSLI